MNLFMNTQSVSTSISIAVYFLILFIIINNEDVDQEVKISILTHEFI